MRIDAPAPVLHLATLGRLALLANGAEEPTLGTRRTKLALLAYLAMQRHPVPRGVLAALLWGERDEQKARNSLSEALSHFRRVLGPDAIASYTDDVALGAGGRLVVDALLLEAASRDHDHAQVTALYAGPFLDGVIVGDTPELEQWASRERLRLETLFVACCAPQCATLARAGRWAECAALAARWLDARPASADAAMHLLEALAAPGTPEAYVAALDAYRVLRRRLDDEYGMAPEPAVGRLATAIERRARAGPRRTPSVGATLRVVREAERAAGDLPPNDLPVATTPLVGREAEVREIAGLLGSARLVTLTGPAGIGKTRLAMEVASRVAARFDGAWFLPLAAVTDPALVLPTVAVRLGADASPAAVASIRARVEGRRVLLVLDNFEQLAADATPLGALLAGVPGATLLVTSQTPLRLGGEHVVPVKPLAAGASDAAVALYVQRARAAQPGFTLTTEGAADVAALCARLDGIPLAIELAASRVRVLPPRAMLQRLAAGLDAVPASTARDAPARHRTLRAALTWMHDQLDAPERALFRRLGAFAGGATPEAIEVVAAGDDVPAVMDTLDALAERSLVVIEEDADGEVRVRLLATLRELARERLAEAGEERERRLRHATHFAALAADEASPAIAREQDELRAAMDWCMAEAPRDAEAAQLAQRLVLALAPWWLAQGMLDEASRRLRALLATTADGTARAPLLAAAARVARRMGDVDAARAMLEERAALHRDADDARGEADALLSLGWLAWKGGDADAAEGHWGAALAASRRAGHRAGEAGALSALGHAAHGRGDHARARGLHEEAVVVRRALDDPRGAARALAHAAWAAAHLGLHADAAAMFDEASALATRLGAPQVHALSLVMAADALLGGSPEHDARLAWQVREEALPVLRAHGHRHEVALALTVLERATRR